MKDYLEKALEDLLTASEAIDLAISTQEVDDLLIYESLASQLTELRLEVLVIRERIEILMTPRTPN